MGMYQAGCSSTSTTLVTQRLMVVKEIINGNNFVFKLHFEDYILECGDVFFESIIGGFVWVLKQLLNKLQDFTPG